MESEHERAAMIDNYGSIRWSSSPKLVAYSLVPSGS